jgi:uncharacterized membrane-anchored protein YitT (DUF2179 family)
MTSPAEAKPIAEIVNSRATHTLWDDAQALVAGTLMVSLGAAILSEAGLITGGTVGVALLLRHVSGVSFGKLFFLVNLPFYYLAMKRLGWVFTLKSFAAVSLLAMFSEMLPRMLQFESIHPLYAAGMGGLLAGIGMLVLFRHNASLGGINVLALYLQDHYGWRAGLVQLAFDATILLLSLPLTSRSAVAISLLGAVVVNLTLAANHRPGRYMAI